VAREVYGMRAFWSDVQELDNEIDAQVQLEMLIDGRRLVERASRWFVHAYPHGLDVAQTIEQFTPGAQELAPLLPEVLKGAQRENFDTREAALREAGVPEELARSVARMPAMLAALDIVIVAQRTECPRAQVAEVFYNLGFQIELNWLRDRIVELPRADRWQALARTALRDELMSLHRSLTEQVLADADADADSETAIGAWREANQDSVDRCLGMLADIRAGRMFDMTTLSVALREVRHLIRGGAQGEGSVAL